MPNSPNELGSTHSVGLENVTPGDHLCLIAEDEAELPQAAAAFVRLGLERGEKCIWVVDPGSEPVVLGALRSSGVDVGPALDAARLVLGTPDSAHLRGDERDPYRMFTFWKRAGAEAARAGFPGLRCIGDVRWPTEGSPQTERWMAFENSLTRLGRDAHCTFLCQYPRKHVRKEIMSDLIRAHPTVVYRGSVCRNIYHADDIDVAGEDEPARHGQILLDTLLQHQRSVDNLKTELSRLSRMTTLGYLAASIAHEVAQPLASVLADAAAARRWLQAEPQPDLSEVRQALERVIASGRRAREVVMRIRSAVTKTDGRLEGISVNALVEDVIALTHDQLATSRIAVHADLGSNLPPLLADRVQIQQVLLNLIVNALEAINMRQNGKRAIVIRTCSEGPEWVHVEVQDSGIGLGSGDPRRIFEAFYTTKPHGMGIGLSVCSTIVQAHGGKLWASRNEGEMGATFHFTLPVQRSHG